MTAADFLTINYQLSTINWLLPLLVGWLSDLLLGDPVWLPHPVVGFGKMIAFGEKRLNGGSNRMLKGAIMSVFLIILVFAVTWFVRSLLFTFHVSLLILCDSIIVFYCLAGTTLIREVREVFHAVDRSLAEGRKQVARIVGRDTSELSAQEVRTAALETLAENLSDGVIAPMFWLAIGGVPAMMAYKMVNTLDSMIGYRTERYKDFGCWAAHIDDVANYIPARITALLMILPSLFTFHFSLFNFVLKYGRKHASPNSGYPEAALAGILNCRFGGPHYYFGELFDKPFIGENDRELTTADMQKAIRVNRMAEVLAIILVIAVGIITNCMNVQCSMFNVQ
jgi:adenosylcobinamide-phosphate synthase